METFINVYFELEEGENLRLGLESENLSQVTT